MLFKNESSVSYKNCSTFEFLQKLMLLYGPIATIAIIPYVSDCLVVGFEIASDVVSHHQFRECVCLLIIDSS